MDTRKIMLIVGALVIAISAAFGVNQMMRGAATPQARAAAAPDITGPMILVATRQLPVGTIVGPDSFRFQPWPKELVEKAYFMKDKTDVNTLVGTVVRYPITAGQPLTQGALVHPDDRGFLAAALGPGMRAVTVKVSQEQGVAGFVFPGDRVDVVLAQTISVEEGSSYPDKQIFTAETIVRNVRILATDQRYDAEDETGKTPVRTFGSVTLEATPEIAEKIAVAQDMGKLSLALRPLAESAGELDAAIASGDINVPAKGGSAAEKRMLAEAAARPVASRSTVTTGGDVSRFWIPVRGRVNSSRAPQAATNGGGFMPSNGGAVSVPTGPVVRVTRGDKMTEVPVGGK
ncbi:MULTISPECIES: Flp pilus assembly protein CpaB [unclassified Sphingopyxis]|jgi:pilus assembly protein CpaB|uniref:Flp pilus assembly protein CpaB n=1 Tax=unclassified Sphingopyxis TaxID=2614943 RepID=UPI000730A1FD|nr:MULTISPECIES: Flp pilus assembly protein CpaB [unclassified Sphingopyxis]KTE02134.1 pilus assembly protein CpaB [Sphingopyxis sp. H012]KTE09882.1 pilus assembly protein CpaB [Sphingopyxis sp. H053]KTE15278.1 pilus assembly protein CpaB [Sphingopyxis sp. H093]KTE29985.1 pilus assembly protein CpaB [Sphingopyxis sp. H080]KTE33673.1 pilus assembly protein CpaB [Sphingopyxis sp. H038]